MSEFERTLGGFRLVQTHRNDDLQTVSTRELGDANRWPELVWLNDLRPPYITTDERQVTAGVILAGSFLRVPAPTVAFTDAADRGQVYERDIALVGKKLVIGEDGDLAVVTGAANLRQQLKHRIDTPRGQARRHPEYGCLIWRMKGSISGPIAGAMGAQHVSAAARADYRISSTSDVSAEIVGDVIRISVTAHAIDGGVVDVFAAATEGE